MPESLFVYGTLRMGAGHPMYDWLTAHCRYLEMGSFQGRMFDVGEYPAVVADPSPQGWVTGEIYTVLTPELLFPRLDRYEGCTNIIPIGAKGSDDPRSLYLRVKAPVAPEGGGCIEAWIYLYNRPTGHLTIIPGGDYLNR
ncbi:MAG: gamma-glutamylcyclotransferase family protein [bacterium]